MDRQKVYNKVRKHLLTQMEQALIEVSTSKDADDHICGYRVYDPTRKKVLKCAVGCLIPFRYYTPEIEGHDIQGHQLLPILQRVIKDYRIEDRGFLADLQQIHDFSPPRMWEDYLDDFAVNYGLEVQS